MKAENYLQIMLESLMIKISILEKLIVFNDEQEKIALADRFDDEAFMSNVDKKGALIDELDKLDEGFNALFNRLKEQLQDNREKYSAEIADMQQQIRRITELSATVEAKEYRNRSLIQSRFQTMRKEVQTAKRSSQMASTYYKSMNKLNYEPHFMDKKK